MTWRIEVINMDHLEDFVWLTKELHEMSAVKHLPWDYNEVRDLGLLFITQPTYFCQLAFHDDAPVGFMAGYVVKLVFSKDVIGNEEGIYVRESVPERAAIAAEMLRRFVRFCRDAGAIDVRAGVIAGIDIYAADVFYRRNGFMRIGTIYALNAYAR